MAVKRKIDVRKQKKMTLAKSFHLCLRGIKHRLLRSSLTLSVVLLAVAFFMALSSENTFIKAASGTIGGEIYQQREAALLLARLTAIPSPLTHSQTLAKDFENDEAIAMNAKITGLPVEFVEKLAEKAYWEQTYYLFFDKMDIGKRLILIDKHKGAEIFNGLVDETAWQEFQKNMEPLRSLKLPGEFPAFREFILGYDAYRQELRRYTKAWGEKVRTLQADSVGLLKEEELGKWLLTASPQQLEEWRNLVTKHGFVLPAEKVERVVDLLHLEALREEVIRALNSKDARERWKLVYKESPPQIEERLSRLTDDGVREDVLQSAYRAEDLDQIKVTTAQATRLSKLAKVIAGKTEANTGSVISGRQVFLLCVSFVVCMVGIANAMLMAITERFREIATMKCLGATDGFILTQFLMEAAIQGVAGGAMGMVIGLLLSMLKNLFIFGRYIYLDFPMLEVAYCGAGSIFAGVILSMLASVYPSWAASRMAPMEAMRIE